LIKVLDLFSGIGGFALAVQNVFGEDNVEFVGFCEIEKYAQKVLAKNFPQVPIFDDITTLQTDQFKDIDLITGGFPCQDISVAGKGKGIVKNETRSGLWFELLRIISDIRPKFALVENVPALTYRGGTIVLGTLAEAGFDAEWQIISAAEMGAWHKRERIWIVAYPQISNRRRVQLRTSGVCGEQQNEKTIGNASSTRSKRSSKSSQTVSNTESERLSRCRRKESGGNKKRVEQNSQEKQSEVRSKSKRCSGVHGDVSNTNFEHEERIGRSKLRVPKRRKKQKERQAGFCDRNRSKGETETRDVRKPSQCTKQRETGEIESGLGRGFDGISSWLDGSWELGIDRTTLISKNRTNRLKGLGNAIVPQCAEVILERLKPLIIQGE
tara:strand:+ start:145 stop:1293 length:1149 start_codon:yes stop_codon:yes gene_type:complete